MLSDEQQRFLSHVKTGHLDECWLWTGGVSSSGYGMFTTWRAGVEGKISAHRMAYALVNGDIPTGLHVLHTCDTKRCCNPTHLYAGTNDQNVTDRVTRNLQAKGSTFPQAKLTQHDVQIIRVLFSIGCTTCEIARRYGMAESTIRVIRQKKAWRHVPDLDLATYAPGTVSRPHTTVRGRH